MPEASGEDLVSQAIAGDRDSLEQLMGRHGVALLHRIESKIPADVHSLTSADDIIQETLVQVYRDVGRLQANDEAGFVAWMTRIAENRLLDAIRQAHCKKRDRRREQRLAAPVDSLRMLLSDLLADEGMETASRIASTAETIHAVRFSIAGLPDDQRRAIQLRYLQQQSLEQTAKEMQRTPDAVRGLLHRAKQSMRASLGRSTRWFPRKQ